MTSDNQIFANRCNAQKSTGPRTASGKRRSRRNAFRHGLTAIAIVETVEDAADYERFERKINADYAPVTSVECALVARLASLLWRLRRAVACESGILQIQAEASLEPGIENVDSRELDVVADKVIHSPTHFSASITPVKHGSSGPPRCVDVNSGGRSLDRNVKLDLARSVLRLADSERDILERIGRYEANLWRQTAQTICLLDSLNTRPLFADAAPVRRTRITKVRRRTFPPKHFFNRWQVPR